MANGNLDSTSWPQLELDEKGAAFDMDDARACFACIHYIITSVCLHKVPKEVLHLELEQCGLPSKHCSCICELLLDENINKLMDHISKKQAG